MPDTDKKTDTSNDYIAKVIHAAPFADNDAGIPQMCQLILALQKERNALASLNPDGVAELVAAGEAFNHPDMKPTIRRNGQYFYEVPAHFVDKLKTALANVKGGV